MTEGPPSLPPAGRHCRECGVTLIEILVSLLLMSFGLLAMGAMQAWSVAGARASGHRIVAAQLASEAADLLRTNPHTLALADADPQQQPPDGPAPGTGDPSGAGCAFPVCTPETLALHDLASLRSRLRLALPQGAIQVSRAPAAGAGGAAEIDLWVMWLEPRLFTHEGEDGRSRPPEQAFDNCPASAKSRAPMPRCFYMRVAL